MTAPSPDPRRDVQRQVFKTPVRRSVASECDGPWYSIGPPPSTVIEIPPVARVDELAAAVAEHVAASDSRRPLLAKPAVSGAVPAVVLGVARLRLAVAKAEAVADRISG